MKYMYLNFEQRCIIETLLNEGKYSYAMIAQEIGVNRSTVHREIHGNSIKVGKNKKVYKASINQKKFEARLKSKNHFIGLTEEMKQLIMNRICSIHLQNYIWNNLSCSL